MTIKIDILNEEKEMEHYDFSEVMEEVKKAIVYWKAMGYTAVIKEFKEEVQKL